MVKCIKCVNSALLISNRIYCNKLRMIICDKLAELDIPCNYYKEWVAKQDGWNE